MSAWRELVCGVVVSASVAIATVNDSPSTTLERQAKWQAPPSARNLRNPISSDRAVLEEGLELYRKNCLTCHGAEGKGNGPAVEFIETRPRDLTAPEITRQATDGEIFWKITEGRKPMPPFKKKLSDDERWKLVHYVRELGRK